MGTLLSRDNGGATNNDSSISRSEGLYKYPPTHGNYFSNQYYLGHRRFETGEPELFLFGELRDLNYLHSKPIKFPYKQPPKSQPLNTLHSFINVQRDSIKLVKQAGSRNDYHIQFMFDSDLPCKFTIFTAISDSLSVGDLKSSGGASDKAVCYDYGAGSEQAFSEENEVIHPGDLSGEGNRYDPANGKNTVPLAILMETDDDQQALLSYCIIDSLGEDNFSIKIIKQKLLADGMELLLQEMYGLENKLKPSEEEEDGEGKKDPRYHSDDDDDDDDGEGEDLGTECVICITDVRDTLLLPCRHFCLCSLCAASLRYQSSNCPICRAPFRALLHIKALEPISSGVTLDDDEITGNPKYSLPGYQQVPLLQALNGYHFKDDDSHSQDQKPSPTSPTTSAEATTEFCVIPIEDDPTPVTSEPAEVPTRTMAKPDSSGEACVKVSLERNGVGVDDHSCCDGVLLPGTPDTSTTMATLKSPDHEEEGGEGCGGGDIQISPCGSSISSGVSVKSTDILLTLHGERN